MKRIIFLFIYIIFCLGCQAKKSTKQFLGDRQFQTTDPARLYFKNIFQALKNRQELSVKTKEESFVPIFHNYQDKANFMMTMNDDLRQLNFGVLLLVTMGLIEIILPLMM